MLRDNLKDTVQTVDGEDVLFYEFEAYTAAFERDPFDDAKDAPGAAFSLDRTQNTILVSGDELDFSARGLDWQGDSQVQRGIINPCTVLQMMMSLSNQLTRSVAIGSTLKELKHL